MPKFQSLHQVFSRVLKQNPLKLHREEPEDFEVLPSATQTAYPGQLIQFRGFGGTPPYKFSSFQESGNMGFIGINHQKHWQSDMDKCPLQTQDRIP